MVKTTPKVSKAPVYFYAIGRRKSAVAAVKLFLAAGDSTINKIAAKKYFSSLLDPTHFLAPFTATGVKTFHFQGRLNGGGLESQSEALILALSRAIKKSDDTQGEVLRNGGFLSVDSRVRQRRNVGTGGKSRRAKQSPKR